MKKWPVQKHISPNENMQTTNGILTLNYLENKKKMKYIYSFYSRAGTIRSAAKTISVRYGPCRYDTYSIRYTCTRLKISKSGIVDFNNKVNILG